MHVHAGLALLERADRLDQREIRLPADAPAAIERFHECAMGRSEVWLPREAHRELPLHRAQLEPSGCVRVERFPELVHARENCTTTAETLSLQVPPSACFMSALQAPSGSLPVR